MRKMGCGASRGDAVSEPQPLMPDTARGVPRGVPGARGKSGFKSEVDENDVGWGSTNSSEIFDDVEESTPTMDELWTIMPAALQTCQLDSFRSVLGLGFKDFRSLSARSILSHDSFNP